MFSGKLEGKPTCPLCKKILDGFSHDSSTIKPNNGDLTICCYCSGLLEFVVVGNDFSYKPLEQSFIDELTSQERAEVNNAQKAALEFNKKRLGRL